MKVAEHLSQSYGDKAFKVARLAQLTGKRWPVVGRKLHDDYPYIEAEVKPARINCEWLSYVEISSVVLTSIISHLELFGVLFIRKAGGEM